MNASARKLVIAAAVLFVLVVVGTLLFQQIPPTVSAPLFVLVVVVEVVIAPIPGGAVGYLGAARYGFWQAWPLLYIGNVIGTTLVFWLARRLGTPLFEENVSASTRARYDAILQQHPALLWLFYSVPLIPVDVLSVLAGLSHMSARRFLAIALSGYVLYTAIVAYVGAFLAEFVGVADALSLLGAIFLLGLIAWLWKHQRPIRPVRVALTGNIASGKSAVADIWRAAGATIIDADELARRVVEPGTTGLRRIVETFGSGVLLPDGTLDRAALRARVFTDRSKRIALEAITHPQIEKLRRREERAAAARGVRLVVHVIPLLFEADLAARYDQVVLVDSPEAVRLERIVSTRGLSEAEAQAMIAAQQPSSAKRGRVHHVIENDAGLAELEHRALAVWRKVQGHSQ